MIPAPVPVREAERLRMLRDLNILDTPPDPRFDSLTAIVRQVFNVSMVAVSLIDRDRQWFKSRQNINVAETPRDISFCGHAILHNAVMVVPDALEDERFADNPLVTGTPSVRFYAGAPLRGHSTRLPYGTLCILDTSPRAMSSEEQQLLRRFADLTEMELEREAERRLQKLLSDSQRQQKNTLRLMLHQEKLAALGQIAAGIAHELNNPLGYILSNMQQLQQLQEIRETYPLELQQETSDIIDDCLKGLRRMADIVAALKDYTHSSQREHKACDINQLLQEALRLTASQLKDYQVDVGLQALSDVQGDSSQLVQVFTNIILNASQAMADMAGQRMGILQVSTHQERNRVVVEIRDNGQGIPPENARKVFDAFFTTREVGGGTGLGLHISYDIIVHKHHGELTFTSEEGQGTVFLIKLPCHSMH